MLNYQIICKTPKNYILKRDIDYINPYRLVRNALYIPYCLGYITSLEIALRNTRTYMHDFQLGIKILIHIKLNMGSLLHKVIF